VKLKLISLLAAAALLTLITWYIQHHNGVRDDPGPIEPMVAKGDKTDDPVPEKYRDMVQKGLAFLAKCQHQDGHWEGDDGQHPVAMTGFVGLALLMERKNPFYRQSQPHAGETAYSPNVRKAVDWLIDKSTAKRDGLIFSEHASETARYMEGHGLATLFLAGASVNENDAARQKKMTDVLMKAVKYIVKSQSSQGGWYHTSKLEGHDFDAILTTAIQIQALQAAENAGIPVPQETLSDAFEYLMLKIGKYDTTGAAPSRTRTLDTAPALACIRANRAWDVRTAKNEALEKWLKYCQAAVPMGRDLNPERDELMHYYYAQAVHQSAHDTWDGYRTALFDRLQQRQDGSWPASNGLGVGPVYATAIWCTILLLDRNSHPSTPRDVTRL
jgi:hypothetical protein